MKTAKVRQISVKVNNTGVWNDFKIALGIYFNQNGVGSKTDLKNYFIQDFASQYSAQN